ncbi:hypothetical protein DMN91_003451, partial [Ooceraea biroi]
NGELSQYHICGTYFHVAAFVKQARVATQTLKQLCGAIRFSLMASLYVAPTLYCWLRCASYLWPKADLKSAVTKALVEQVTYSPVAMCSFFFCMSFLELKPISECIEEIKIKFWPTYKYLFLLYTYTRYAR